jgi:hypothetical protein
LALNVFIESIMLLSELRSSTRNLRGEIETERKSMGEKQKRRGRAEKMGGEGREGRE